MFFFFFADGFWLSLNSEQLTLCFFTHLDPPPSFIKSFLDIVVQNMIGWLVRSIDMKHYTFINAC